MSKVDDLLSLLSDCDYHCSICLNKIIQSGQLAKVAQNLRDSGYAMEKVGRVFGMLKPCSICQKKTVHYKLLSTEKKEDKTRKSISNKVQIKMKEIYEYKDNFINSSSCNLEIDHRIPPRVSGMDERSINNNDTEENIRNNFQFLSKENNNIKREACKKCQETKQRGIYLIDFFYEGTKEYLGTCEGCFFAYPEKWKKALNEIIHKG